ncbi:hypothetical protein HZB02_00250 [Candidatus Woesearchaeota archaeon]|nr:hypothetical protein [Candidatus Woesearchaeota archaeon]
MKSHNSERTFLLMGMGIGIVLGALVVVVLSSLLVAPVQERPAPFRAIVLPDIASPYDWVAENNILINPHAVSFSVPGYELGWASFADTHSMDPTLDATAHAIQIMPHGTADIHRGDIVTYRSSLSGQSVVHRVVAIAADESGWYVLMKGDNNPDLDPEKVRFNQIERVVVAIIY